MASRLEDIFEQRTDGKLRSIVKYDGDRFEIVHLCDDVANQHTEEEIEDAIDDSRWIR